MRILIYLTLLLGYVHAAMYPMAMHESRFWDMYLRGPVVAQFYTPNYTEWIKQLESAYACEWDSMTPKERMDALVGYYRMSQYEWYNNTLSESSKKSEEIYRMLAQNQQQIEEMKKSIQDFESAIEENSKYWPNYHPNGNVSWIINLM
jgi:hypothetical protein